MILPRRIVLVCSGNTCRSTMAEAMLRKALADEFGGASDGVSVVSAGIYANEGDPASANAIAAMKELGLDIASHRARLLTDEILKDADLVLTMTSAHKQAVLLRYPSLQGKVMTLNEFAGLSDEFGPDIPDPFGRSIDVYRATAKDIGRSIERVIRRIKDRSAGSTSEKKQETSEEAGRTE
ncbi:MAG: low molecular weight protein arginine phosphatase [Bacillota bacterium]